MDSSTKDEVMALVVDNLDKNEAVVLELKKHWMFLADALFFCIISIPFVFPLIITVPFFFYKLARYNKDKVVITDRKFDVKIGLISVDSVSTPLNKINNFHYSQGFFGRMFGYGTVFIQSAAAAGESGYTYISKPAEAKAALERATEAYETKR